MPTSSDAAARPADATPADRAAAATRGLRLLSTLPFGKVPFWTAAVQDISPRPGGTPRWLQRLGLLDPARIGTLLRQAPRADAVLINGGERTDLLYLALAGLLPWIRTPHLIVDAHWQPGAGRLHRALQRAILRAGRRLLAEVQIHSPEEIEPYARHFGLPRSVLRPLPWSTSLTGYDIRRRSVQGEAIVSGGHSYRDYTTLLAAVRETGWPVRIGLPASPVTQAVRAQAADLPNVQIVSDWSFQDYWQQVADSRVFAMPIVPGLQRCTADQTLLNAMALGTIVVATDALSSRLYIRHGETGFLVPEGDPAAWRRQLQAVFELPQEQAQRIRDAAQRAATTTFGEEERLAQTLERAARVARHAAHGAGRPAEPAPAGLLARLKRWWWLGGGAVAAGSMLAVEA
ncbi:MAG: glycosyltransferase [Burkholderiaceae bacterium]|nr:glycosyltransferase [Burkholderiaceae bacterium]